MADVRIPGKLILRNDTAENWASANPILLKGEAGLETDTLKIKFGDGVKVWSALAYFTLDVADISGLGTAATLNSGITAGNVPVLGDGGKLNAAVLPSIALMDVFEVADEAAMLALEAQTGDIAVRSDVSKTFILKQIPATALENWTLLKTPTDGVSSVNGLTGAVTLNTDNVQEGTSNQYYTDERAAQCINRKLAETPVAELKDGSSVLMKTDTLILNGGNANG